MKNLVHPPLKNGPERCKTSEVFCKPSNLKNATIKEINSLKRMCSNRPHDLQRMFKTMKTQQRQGLTAFEDEHCRPPISYRDREVIPADAVLPLSYCVRVARAQEVVR